MFKDEAGGKVIDEFVGLRAKLYWYKMLEGRESKKCKGVKQEGHDGPVSLHWLIREIHSYQTLHYLGIGLKHKTPYKD